MINLKSIPFFKILLPYILGVFCFMEFENSRSATLLFTITASLLIITYLIQKFHKPRSRIKQWVYLGNFYVFIFLLAQQNCWLYEAKNNTEHYSHFKTNNEQLLLVTVNDLPVTHDKYVKVPLAVNCIKDQQDWHYCKGETILYLKKDSLHTIQLGSQLLINGTLSFLQDPKNPQEFDYKSFLKKRNIYHVVYAKPQQIYSLPTYSHDYTLQGIGVSIKAYVVNVLRNSGLSQQAFSICTALLVGYDDEIDNEVMQQFAHSGTLHVLSVSGIHTGLLYGLIVWLFSLFDKHEKYRFAKTVVVIGFLFLFTLITGLSASVLRASVMLSFIVIGNTFYKNGNNYNTLFLSAFVILLFNPFLISDVGFLLSYSAVFGIMYFYPLLKSIHTFDNKIMQWSWGLTLMSVSATITTLPISLAVFHQFPIWFVLSNLIIIPLSTLLMALSGLLLLLFKVSFIKTGLVFVVNFFTKIMLFVAEMTNHNGFGYIDDIAFSNYDSLFLMACIALLIVVFTLKEFRYVVLFATVIIGWLVSSIIINYQQLLEKELVVFYIKQKSFPVIRIGKTMYADTTAITKNELERSVKPYLLLFSNYELIHTTAQVALLKQKNIITHYQSNIPLSTINADFLVVGQNTKLDFSKLQHKKTIIVADASNNYKTLKNLQKQCVKFGVPFYNVKEKGAFRVPL